MEVTYKPRVKSANDRALFFAVFVVGIVGALTLKTFPQSDIVRVWAPLIFDVALQLFYAFCVMVVPRFKLREDRAGDSFYYLGLLFTLASLAHTLWAFGLSASTDFDTAQIISGFGIALATTIFGIALRVFAQQFRADPVEIEAEARNALVDAASQLTGQLYSVVSEMGTFRQSIRQVTEEGIRETVESATSAMTTTANKFTSEVETLVRTLDSTFKTFSATAEDMAKSSKASGAALSRLATRIDKIEPPENVVEAVFGPARDHMLKVASSLTKAADAQKEQLQNLGELVKMSVKGLGGLEDAVFRIRSGSEEIGKSFGALQSISRDLAGISTELNRLLAQLSEASARQKGLQDRLASDAAAVPQKIDTALESVTRAHANAAAEIARTTQALNDAAGRHIQQLTAQLTRAEAASTKLIDEVVHMADTIAEKLA